MSDAELDGFEEICRCHSAVLDGALSTKDVDQSRRFARSMSAPHAARQYLTETLQGWQLDALIPDAVLVVSLVFEWNYPSVVIEVFWALISIYGIVRARRERAVS